MYNPNDYTRGMATESLSLERAVSNVLRNVYGWMAIGLAITALVAMGIASQHQIMSLLLTNKAVLWFPMLIELGIVFYAGVRLEKMAFSTMAVLMVAYAALNGVTLSFIFLAYTVQAIAVTFTTCAAMFAVLCLVGHTTNTDMASWGKYFMMALVGVIVATVANFFFHSPGLDSFISYAGVLLFVGLTAYDAQKIKKMVAANYQAGALDMRKLALWGSLSLYLDFINLFLYLLRIMGSRRN